MEELKALAFQDGEVPQAHEGAIPVKGREPESKSSTSPPVSNPICHQVLAISDGEGASAAVDQIFNWKNNIFPGGSTLAAYKGIKSQTAFGRLREALKTCRSFSEIGDGGKYRSTLTPENSPHVGNESLCYRITTLLNDGRIRDDQYVVVRVGSTIATFTAMDVDRRASFPSDLIDKQVERLTSAQHR